MSAGRALARPLRGHGRYAYSGITERADFSWPADRRLAFYVALNLEHYAFGEGMTEQLVGGSPEPDVANWSWREYGNRVGAWRLLELFEELALPAALLVNTDAIRTARNSSPPGARAGPRSRGTAAPTPRPRTAWTRRPSAR